MKLRPSNLSLALIPCAKIDVAFTLSSRAWSQGNRSPAWDSSRARLQALHWGYESFARASRFFCNGTATKLPVQRSPRTVDCTQISAPPLIQIRIRHHHHCGSWPAVRTGTRFPCAAGRIEYSAMADDPTSLLPQDAGGYVSRASTASYHVDHIEHLGETASIRRSEVALEPKDPLGGCEVKKRIPQDESGGDFPHSGSCGKLKGRNAATTPRGWRMENRSMPGNALSVNSTSNQMWYFRTQTRPTSRPRGMSPGVGNGLPRERSERS